MRSIGLFRLLFCVCVCVLTPPFDFASLFFLTVGNPFETKVEHFWQRGIVDFFLESVWRSFERIDADGSWATRGGEEIQRLIGMERAEGVLKKKKDDRLSTLDVSVPL